MDELKFREGIDNIASILKVFVAAKKDNGKTFIDELNKFDKDHVTKLLNHREKKNKSDEKVNGIRVRTLRKLSEGSVTIDDVNQFFKEEKEKNKFSNWSIFGILYSLYYLDLEQNIKDYIEELLESLKPNFGSNVRGGYNDFNGGQNYGTDVIYIGIFNDFHKTRETAKQFRIQTLGDDKFIIGLYKDKDFIEGEYSEYQIDSITYQDILNEIEKYKADIQNDSVNPIDFIKENIDKYADIKEKAAEERKFFNEKFPLEKIKDLTLEEYNTGMGNANKGTFTWYLNADYAVAGWLFSNGQNRLFFKGEDGSYQVAKNMKSYLERGNGDINSAFQFYKEDLYNFVKNFDVTSYNPKSFLDGAKFLKASLIYLYKGDILVTLALPASCYAIANALNILPEGEERKEYVDDRNGDARNVDIISCDILISKYLEEQIPDIVKEYGYAALGKCLDKYYEIYLMKNKNKETSNQGIEYYAVGADLGNGDRQQEFYNRSKLIIGWYEIGDLKQFKTEDALIKRFKECNYHDTESHFKQTFSMFKQLRKGDVVCLKSVHLQKKEMYIYAVGEVLEGYNKGYEYLDGLGHSIPVKWKILDERYVVSGAKYQKTLTKIKDDEIKKLLDELLGEPSNTTSLPLNTSTMISLNTILYGVPGTGKTYNTVNYAVSIIEGKSIEEVQNECITNRDGVRSRYEKYVKDGQIMFTTFHQSIGYEDFIEGIKAKVNEENGSINYTVEPGIFKNVCKAALKGENTVVDNFEESWNALVEKLNESDFIDIPLISDEKKTFKIELNEYGTGLANRTYENDKFEKGEWIQGKSKFFSKDQLYNIYKGLPGVPQGGHDNYRKAIVNEMKKHFGLNEYKENLFSTTKKNYVFIIDEINRGNISKIFGELITLLEPDKRLGGKEELKVRLPYSNEEFGVPNNLYILGTMNTADRSIALMDLALRRRFTFKEIEPDSSLLSDIPDIKGINIKGLFETINKRIEFLYDRDHLLGHAYFMSLKKNPTIEELNYIMLNKIIPQLQEYFHDDWEKIQLVLGDKIVEKTMVSASDIGIKSSEYEDLPKYTIKNNISESDYQY